MRVKPIRGEKISNIKRHTDRWTMKKYIFRYEGQIERKREREREKEREERRDQKEIYDNSDVEKISEIILKR